jgi:hypothetical protein
LPPGTPSDIGRPGDHLFRITRKHLIHPAYNAFSPLALYRWFHRIYLHRLHQAMDAERANFCKTLHEGKLEEFGNHLVEGEEIRSSVLKRRTPMSRAIPDEFLWDLISSQESAETQEVGCCGVCLFDLMKRE